MDDPVFDFYKKFYKKASSWFLGTIVVLIVLAAVGITYVAIARLKAKTENANTNSQNISEQKNDTEMDSDNINGSEDEESELDQNLQDDGLIPNPSGSLGANYNTNNARDLLDEQEF